jgi:hypothetical protein
MEAYYNALAQQDAQLAAEGMQAGQAQTLFGADLFRTGGNLGNQMYALQSAALGPYQSYLSGATGLEALGQQPFEMGSNLGRNIANTTGANALYQGGIASAGSMAGANAYNPFATALTGASQNKDFMRGLSRLFGGGGNEAIALGGYGI